MLVFRNTPYSVMSTDNVKLSKKVGLCFYCLPLKTCHWIHLCKQPFQPKVIEQLYHRENGTQTTKDKSDLASSNSALYELQESKL